MTRNPFRYGALALDEAFTDRGAEIDEITADMLNGQDVVIFAPRRYGKSSLIWRVMQDLEARGVLIAHVDLMSTPTPARLAAKLARTVHDDVASPLFRARERLRVFQGLRVRPTVTVDPDDATLSFGFEPARSAADLDATIERLLELPAELAADRDRPAALVFDEFQEVIEIDPGLPKLLRSVFQEQPGVAHVYLGSKRHMMGRIFSDEQEPFWRSAKQMELGVIAPAQFGPHLVKQFRRTRRRLDEAAADRVLAVTGGHPYGTQELAYFLWQETGEGETATAADVELALARVLRSEHAHFSLVWQRASSAQRRLLIALSSGPARPLGTEYRHRHDLPATSTVQRALEALERQELVFRERGEAWIAEPFLAEWIRRDQP